MEGKGELLVSGDELLLQAEVRRSQRDLREYFVMSGVVFGALAAAASDFLRFGPPVPAFYVVVFIMFVVPSLLLPTKVLKVWLTFPTGVFNAYEKGFDSPVRIPGRRGMRLNPFIPFAAVQTATYKLAGRLCLVGLNDGTTLRLLDRYGFDAYRTVCERIQHSLGKTSGPDFELMKHASKARHLFDQGKISEAEMAQVTRREREVNGKSR